MSAFVGAKLDEFRQSLEGKIDFVGQDKTDKLMKQILWSMGGAAFFVGFVLQSLMVTFGIFGIGFLGCCVVILPPYPTYNAHPVKWITPNLNEYGELLQGEVTEGKIEGKKDR